MNRSQAVVGRIGDFLRAFESLVQLGALEKGFFYVVAPSSPSCQVRMDIKMVSEISGGREGGRSITHRANTTAGKSGLLERGCCCPLAITIARR